MSDLIKPADVHRLEEMILEAPHVDLNTLHALSGMRTGIAEAYASAHSRLSGMTLAEFDKNTQQFAATPLYYLGECRGAMLVLGNEVHACVTPPWYARQAIRVINDVIDQYGEATTHATTEAGRRMVEKLGFVKDGEIYRRNAKWELKL